jgi:hypothetical protein
MPAQTESRGKRQPWPEPTVPEPSWEEMEEWMWEDSAVEASDGCIVELDGVCPHGHPSWLRRSCLV